MDSVASTHQAARMHDLELESIPVGPHTRMILLAADDQGCVAYLSGKRHRHQIPLTRAHARMPLLLLDAGRWSLMLDPATRRLAALTFFSGATCRTVLLGSHWGTWINEHGGEIRAISIPELLLRWDAPVMLHEDRQTLGLDFPINIYNREVFTPSTLLSFKDGTLRHNLELHFGYPLGGFRQGRLRLEDEHSARIVECVELEGFPLIVPDKPVRPPEPPPPPKPHIEPPKPKAAAPRSEPPKAHPAPPRPEPPKATPSKPASPFPHAAPQNAVPRWQPSPGAHASGSPMPPPHAHPHAHAHTPPHVPPHAPHTPPHAPQASASPKPAAPPFPPHSPRPSLTASVVGANVPAERPIPRTEHLSLNEMLTVLATESSTERRWKILEANLTLGRPERTYPLIARYPELIGEQAAHWAPARLKVVFTSQPGAVLIGIMESWAVNQVLAVAEGSSEPARIMQWLREREIERLLKLDLSKEPVSAEGARRVLSVDKHADEAVVKKVWRTLLAFMNADHGRSEERAIHRKKDEIAKHLQVARNVLLQHL